MIKKVKVIKTIKNIYKKNIELFEFIPPIEIDQHVIKYLAGGYYNEHDYPQVALYESDENGKIINNIPVILEEGIPKYEQLFRNYGYTLI